MRKFFIMLVVGFLHIGLKGSGQACNCRANLDSLRERVEKNYVGFDIKTKDRAKYEDFVDSLDIESSTCSGYRCYEIWKKYLDFFKDPHLILWVNPNRTEDKTAVKLMFSELPSIRVNVDSLVNSFTIKKLQSLEGIYKSNDFPYRIAVFRDNNDANHFFGINIDPDNVVWFKGQVKLEITKTLSGYNTKFYRYDHFPVFPRIKVEKNTLEIVGNGTWIRMNGTNLLGTAHNEFVSFRQLSEKTNLITVKSSFINYKDELDSILGANASLLEKCENLIVDLRNNNGGHIMTFDSLNSYILGGPVISDGLILKSSVDNILQYKQLLLDPLISMDVKDKLQSFIALMDVNKGKLVKVLESDTTYFTRKKFPKKVAILVNESTASASELFVMYAKQSSKVIVVGSNTRGALDYTELGHPYTLSCPFVLYYIPMGMSDHNTFGHIDNIGLKPDINLVSYKFDWISYTLKILERKNI
jgi:hypothetical protein